MGVIGENGGRVAINALPLPSGPYRKGIRVVPVQGVGRIQQTGIELRERMLPKIGRQRRLLPPSQGGTYDNE